MWMLISQKDRRDRTIRAVILLGLSYLYTITNRPVAHPIDLKCAWDLLIPVIPWTVLLYHSWYPAIWGLILLLSPEEQDRYLERLIFAKGICVFVFIAFPSIADIRPALEGGDVFTQLLGMTYQLDAPYCAFPSAHVALACVAMYSAICTHRHLGSLYVIWQFAVIISTLTTRQHLYADVIGGMAVAALVIAFRPKKEVLCLPSNIAMDIRSARTKATSPSSRTARS